MVSRKILQQSFFLFILGLLCSSCETEIVIYPSERVLQFGDDLAWASSEFDDSDWEQIGSTHQTGIFWVRFEIDFDYRIDQLQNKGIQMISIASYEAYWDGVLIHQEGKIGSSLAEETAGKFISHIMLPDSLCQIGKHKLALRLSNHHNTNVKGSWNTFFVEEYKCAVTNNLKLTAFMFILAGAYLIAAIYYLFLFFNKRKEYSKFIFSLLCFFFFGLIMVEYSKFYFNYPYHFHYYRLFIIGFLTMAIAFTIPLFLSVHFEIPKRKYFNFIYGSLLIFVVTRYNIIDDQTGQFISKLMLGASVFLTITTLVLKRKGSWVIAAALISIGLINYFFTYNLNQLLYSYDINLFIGFTILVLSMLYLMTQKNKEQQQKYEASLLHSARLQNELLKKNIQPHFIMNTLTSIMEWVEVSPKKSIEFIEALAGEFEILNKIADQQLIPIDQEINLCKRHLEIMGYRKEVKYLWEDGGINAKEQIPPAIFHTMIENGITHNVAAEDGKFIFRLTFESTAKQKIYTLLTIAKNRKKQSRKTSGTGIKYIQSRLTESYGEGWELISEEVEKGWRSIVIIEKANQ
ncbi:MAG: histidine kinase [Saprospiraceae bacterium]